MLSLLEQLTAAMTDRQRALYKLLRCRADPMAPEALDMGQEACRVLGSSAAMMELTSLYLLRGTTLPFTGWKAAWWRPP